MRLTRTVHTTSQVFYGPLADLLPDIASVGSGGADHVLLFVSDDADAHGFVISEDGAKQLARTILGLEIARVVPAAGNGHK